MSGGLENDSVGGAGLLMLDDAYEERPGQYRKRGGKSQFVASVLANKTFSGGHDFYDQLGSITSAYEGTGYHILVRALGGTSFVDLGAGVKDFGLASDAAAWFTHFTSSAQVDEEVVFATPSLGPVGKWGGSRKSAYGTGTVHTSSSTTTTTITGIGTSWSANAEAGMYIRINNGTVLDRYFRIRSVESDTALTVDVAPGVSIASGAAVTYVITPVGVVDSKGTNFAGATFPRVNGNCASHQGRLFLGGVYTGTRWLYERVHYSANPADIADTHYVGVDNFHADSYFDVYPGIGGAIRSMVSLSNQEMVIFKENAMFALRGAVELGRPEAGYLDIISPTVGCRGRYSTATTPIGLVWANRDGLWVYDGSSVRNLTSGRVGIYYRENLIDGSSDSPFVSCLGSRIVVQGPTSSHDTLVYDVERDSFSTQTCSMYSPLARTYDSNGALDADVGILYNGVRADDWSDDLTTTNKNDAGSSTTPRLFIRTKPVDIRGNARNGRVSHVFVDGYVADAASDNPTLDVKLHMGEVPQGSNVSTSLESPITVGSVPEGTYDRVHRLRAKSQPAKAAWVEILQANAASDARVTGLEVASVPVNRTR